MSDPGPGRALFAFVRHWSRRSWSGGPGAAERGRLVLVTEAVDALVGRGLPATVNAVAREIGIDQSGASRLIKGAAAAGYLTMSSPDTDGRRRQAAVTASGHTLLEQAQAWQERIFDRLTEGWSERRRRDFLLAMAELVDRSYTVDS
ncbi:MarR family winged helix-turn-helix transcriptional regulator [Amorphoplanes nipponensis]|uniref:MarR family transcriptional regulator n=1 Tax=Actinoplanes nipponensis TaxID=135950 RepID=A0A919MMB9_9ACTN|nr:MarR family winged helix-turn-helix transcriptional regulator [Actinoplanes nipponensis]GIE47253.1 MarR family transcriptional regulator [Actinoplanes nipponensis]